MTDYEKYRGKCKELSEEAIKQDPTLRLVRGYYYCPIWGQQDHWWCERADGSIYDPTKNQFPSKGIGHYEEFNGLVYCEQCGKEMKEEEAQFAGRYPVCSLRCYAHLVGVSI